MQYPRVSSVQTLMHGDGGRSTDCVGSGRIHSHLGATAHTARRDGGVR
jgi:hypothetical protein